MQQVRAPLILGGGAGGRRAGADRATSRRRGRPRRGRDRVLLAASRQRVGEALGDALRGGRRRAAPRRAREPRPSRDGDDYVLGLEDGDELRGDRLLVATGRRPRVDDLGLETVGIEPDKRGIEVDERLRAADGRLGDRRRQRRSRCSRTSASTRAGSPPADILGQPRRADHRADARASSSPTRRSPSSARRGPRHRHRADLRRPARADLRRRLGDAPAPHPAQRRRGADRRRRGRPRGRRGLKQATLAIRARVPLDVLRDTIQPFPTFSEIYVNAMERLVKALRRRGRLPGRDHPRLRGAQRSRALGRELSRRGAGRRAARRRARRHPHDDGEHCALRGAR